MSGRTSFAPSVQHERRGAVDTSVFFNRYQAQYLLARNDTSAIGEPLMQKPVSMDIFDIPPNRICFHMKGDIQPSDIPATCAKQQQVIGSLAGARPFTRQQDLGLLKLCSNKNEERKLKRALVRSRMIVDGIAVHGYSSKLGSSEQNFVIAIGGTVTLEKPVGKETILYPPGSIVYADLPDENESTGQTYSGTSRAVFPPVPVLASEMDHTFHEDFTAHIRAVVHSNRLAKEKRNAEALYAGGTTLESAANSLIRSQLWSFITAHSVLLQNPTATTGYGAAKAALAGNAGAQSLEDELLTLAIKLGLVPPQNVNGAPEGFDADLFVKVTSAIFGVKTAVTANNMIPPTAIVNHNGAGSVSPSMARKMIEAQYSILPTLTSSLAMYEAQKNNLLLGKVLQDNGKYIVVKLGK